MLMVLLLEEQGDVLMVLHLEEQGDVLMVLLLEEQGVLMVFGCRMTDSRTRSAASALTSL